MEFVKSRWKGGLSVNAHFEADRRSGVRCVVDVVSGGSNLRRNSVAIRVKVLKHLNALNFVACADGLRITK